MEIAQHLHGAAERDLGVDHPVVAMEAPQQFCELLVIDEGPCRAGAHYVSSAGDLRVHPTRSVRRTSGLVLVGKPTLPDYGTFAANPAIENPNSPNTDSP